MELGIDNQQALDASFCFHMKLEMHVTDQRTRAEYNRLRTLLPDPWRLGQFRLRSYR